MNQGWLRLLDPNVVAYSLIGMAAFQYLDWGREPTPRTLPQLGDMCKDLLLQGISGQKSWQRPRDLAAPTVSGDQVDANELRWQETEGAGNRTKRAIFQAAEQAFGQYGYSRAQISEITRRAGVAQGTFYVHFRSKEDLLDGVVRFLSHELRRTLRGITSQARDRRDREREGMIAFFHFICRHSRIYRIVAESEAIVPESARYYYRKLDQSYQRSLSPGMQRGELRELPLDFLAHSLMGLNHMIGLRWLIWNAASGLALPGPVLHDAVDLVFFGLSLGS
jgi:AcrR family transcriptional regulator